MPVPYEVIAGPIQVYQAPVGEVFPLIDAAPAGNWALIGTSGDRNITEDGVTVANTQTTEVFRSLGGTGPQKVFRTEEDLIVSFVLADLSLEQYRHVLDSNVIAENAPQSGIPGYKALDMYRGFGVSQFALLIRGEFSAYGDGFNTQFQVPVCFQTGSPEVVFVKGVPGALAFEFTAIEDPAAANSDERFGKIIMQDAVALA